MKNGLFLGNANYFGTTFEEYKTIFTFVGNRCVYTKGDHREVLHLDNDRVLIKYDSGDMWLTRT